MFIVCGEALFDVFATGATATGLGFDGRIGGSPFNVALGLARLGQPVGFFGGIGTGFAGERPGPGTLYGALARLERRGLIESVPTQDRRQPYRLSGAGATILREQLTNLERLTSVGRERLVTE